MATRWIDAIRACFKKAGFATTKDGAESGGRFLVGHAGRLFSVHDDYHIGEEALGFDAVGCGSPYVLGSLHSTVSPARATGFSPAQRIQKALEAAEAFCAAVRGPYTILGLPHVPE